MAARKKTTGTPGNEDVYIQNLHQFLPDYVDTIEATYDEVVDVYAFHIAGKFEDNAFSTYHYCSTAMLTDNPGIYATISVMVQREAGEVPA